MIVLLIITLLTNNFKESYTISERVLSILAIKPCKKFFHEAMLISGRFPNFFQNVKTDGNKI